MVVNVLIHARVSVVTAVINDVVPSTAIKYSDIVRSCYESKRVDSRDHFVLLQSLPYTASRVGSVDCTEPSQTLVGKKLSIEITSQLHPPGFI